MEKIKRLEATEKAIELIKMLSDKFGDLMFYQSGGCCEGTQPQCFEKGGFYLRFGDVCIGYPRLIERLGFVHHCRSRFGLALVGHCRQKEFAQTQPPRILQKLTHKA